MNTTEERHIKHIIAIMSGKGGVGKSVVIGLLAIALQKQGFQVGILDGDLTFPTITQLFDPSLELSFTDEGRIEPLVSTLGIKIMSMRPMLENETDATAWQGTMVASAFKQFYRDVEWGDLDYLLIDVPPGTSDVPIMILRSIPLDGVILVSSPQKIATTGVKKCISMVQQYHIPILGVVENMAYFIAPGKEYCEPFGPGQSSELVNLADAPLLARLPLDPELSALCDAGRIELYALDAHRDLTRFVQPSITR